MPNRGHNAVPDLCALLPFSAPSQHFPHVFELLFRQDPARLRRQPIPAERHGKSPRVRLAQYGAFHLLRPHVRRRDAAVRPEDLPQLRRIAGRRFRRRIHFGDLGVENLFRRIRLRGRGRPQHLPHPLDRVLHAAVFTRRAPAARIDRQRPAAHIALHFSHINHQSLFFVPVGKADCRFARRGKDTNTV